MTTPTIEWAALTPILIVLGTAVFGVLVEAFSLGARGGRSRPRCRWPRWPARLAAVVWRWTAVLDDGPKSGPSNSRARGPPASEPCRRIFPPWLSRRSSWCAPRSRSSSSPTARRPARIVRRLRGDGARVARRTRGHGGGVRADGDFPPRPVRRRRHARLHASAGDLLTPSSPSRCFRSRFTFCVRRPADVALRPRRLRSSTLSSARSPLRSSWARPCSRLLRLARLLVHRIGSASKHRNGRAARRRLGARLAGLLFKVGAALPFVDADASRRPHARHGLHGRRNEDRRLWRDDQIRSLDRTRGRDRAPARLLGDRHSDDARGHGRRNRPVRRQTHARSLSIAHAGFSLCSSASGRTPGTASARLPSICSPTAWRRSEPSPS